MASLPSRAFPLTLAACDCRTEIAQIDVAAAIDPISTPAAPAALNGQHYIIRCTLLPQSGPFAHVTRAHGL